MYTSCFFYGNDGFVLEKMVWNLEPNGKDKTFDFNTFIRFIEATMEMLKVADRKFLCVAAFTVQGHKIAYYEEII